MAQAKGPTALKPGRGRRPADDVRRASLAAANELLLADGMVGVTFAKVAERAGVSKMTLYKWWPSPGTLAFEAYAEGLETALAFPDTGDLRRDLATQLRSFLAHLRRNAKVVAELIGAAQSDPELRTALENGYVRHRRELAVARLDAAREAGQTRVDLDAESVVDQLWGACYHRLLLPGPPLDEAFVEDLLDNLFRGIGVS